MYNNIITVSKFFDAKNIRDITGDNKLIMFNKKHQISYVLYIWTSIWVLFPAIVCPNMLCYVLA